MVHLEKLVDHQLGVLQPIRHDLSLILQRLRRNSKVKRYHDRAYIFKNTVVGIIIVI